MRIWTARSSTDRAPGSPARAEAATDALAAAVDGAGTGGAVGAGA